MPPGRIDTTSQEVTVTAQTWKNNILNYENTTGRTCLLFFNFQFQGRGEIHVQTSNGFDQSDRGSSGTESNRCVSICAPLISGSAVGCSVWASIGGTFYVTRQVIRL